MCGFVAVLGPGEPLALPLLERMRDRLAHRGPDGAGVWQGRHAEGSIALGFRRLAIIDIRHVADQPMVSQDGRKAIVFNGEIYNFVELRSELEAAGRIFRTRGDTEVLLQAYEHWGEAVVERLNGMFTFVIWDKVKGRVFIARDRFGEKPLFMCRLPDGKIAFASEIKALLAHPDADATYDLTMFGRIIGGHVPFGKAETLFKNVNQFGAAHCMTLSAGGKIISERRYWSPNYDHSLAEVAPEELTDRLRGHLERSLAMRMRSDVPVTACLSGGLDSSSLVALLAGFPEAQGRIQSAISVRFPDDPTIDEGNFIDMVLNQTGLQGHAISPTAADLTHDLRQLHWHHETIIPGLSMYLEWCLMRQARQLGNKVIIDGQGADEVFAGYSCYFRAYQAELLTRGPIGFIQALSQGRIRDARLKQVASKYNGPSRRFNLRDSLNLGQYAPYLKYSIPAQISRYGGDGMPSLDAVKALRFDLALNLLRTSLPSNLYSGDRNSMAHGIEARYPYLDYELVDFAMQLPDNAYITNGWSKFILRKAVADKLPTEVVWRSDKVGFAAPQDKWFANPQFKEWVQDRIFDDSLAGLTGYSKDVAAKFWAELKSGSDANNDQLWKWASAAELLEMGRLNMWKDQRDIQFSPSKRSGTLVVEQTAPLKRSDRTVIEPIDNGGYFRKGSSKGKKTAWIISYTPVSKEPRVLRQAKTLLSEGWRVVIFGLDGAEPAPEEWHFVSLSNSHFVYKKIFTGIKQRSIIFLNKIGIIMSNYGCLKVIKRMGANLAHNSTCTYISRARIVKNFASLYPDYRPNLVLAHDYFTCGLAVEIGNRFSVPVSVDCHEYAIGQYAHDSHWLKWHQSVVQNLQDSLFSKVDSMTVVCEGIAKLIATDHVLRRPPSVVRSTPFYVPQPFRPTGEIITVLYHGEIFPSRALHIAVRSMRLWRPEFRFVIRGYSDPAYVIQLREIAAEVGVADRLDIQGPVPFDQIILTANKADVGYFVHIDTSPQRSFALPNKFFEYVMAGLALVVSNLPEMAKLVGEFDLGVLVSECDEECIARTINSLDRASIDRMKHHSLEAAKILNWDVEKKVMMSSYQEILE